MRSLRCKRAAATIEAMTYFTKRYHPPGTPPGTLSAADADAAPARITVVDYTDERYHEQSVDGPEACLPFLEHPATTWIHVQGVLGGSDLHKLGEMFHLHALALEDVLNTGQRPKFDVYGDQVFVVMSLPVPRGDRHDVEQISLFVGKEFIVSFHNGENDPFVPLRKRLANHVGRIRSKEIDYLLYSILDIIIDQGFPVLEVLGERIEEVEVELLEGPTKETLAKIHGLKRELLLLRRMLWPQREIINGLAREDLELVQVQTRPYFRDCYDHTVHIMDLIESYRDMTASMLDVYLSSVSNKLNETMKVLTVISTIFIPLTFIVGVYGMNFDPTRSPWSMPELSWYYGYPAVWAVMLGLAGAMLVLFKRKNWF